MCGRFTREFTWKQVHDFLDLQWPSLEEMGPAYNIAPSQTIPVCRVDDSGRRLLAAARWGFIPAWAKEPGRQPINARCETIATSGLFRSAFHKRRCLVPASGFYEWKKLEGGGKAPMYIRLVNDAILCFAGVWESWRPREESGEMGPPVETVAILTTRPNELMATIHDRMPVIVQPKDFDRWLKPQSDEDLGDVFAPYPAELMEAHRVSTRVNSPKNDGPELARASEGSTPAGGAGGRARRAPKKPPEAGLFGK